MWGEEERDHFSCLQEKIDEPPSASQGKPKADPSFPTKFQQWTALYTGSWEVDKLQGIGWLNYSNQTLARDIGLEKHWSKCISAKAILHLSACATPASDKTDWFELPYMHNNKVSWIIMTSQGTSEWGILQVRDLILLEEYLLFELINTIETVFQLQRVLKQCLNTKFSVMMAHWHSRSTRKLF